MISNKIVEATSRKPAKLSLLESLGAAPMFLGDAYAEKAAGVDESGYVAATVGQQPVELERAPRKREHPVRRVTLVKQRLTGRQGQRPSQALEARKLLAAQSTAKRAVANFTPLARVANRQTLVAARRWCKHFASLSDDLDQSLR